MKSRYPILATGAFSALAVVATLATSTVPLSDDYQPHPIGSPTALKADEGVPHNLVTALKADEGVPHNLVTALKADEGVPHNLVTA